MQEDPQQLNNLLGGVDYGWGYGPFLKFVAQQLPEVYPTARRLDDRLTEVLTQYGGSRQPVWRR